MLYDQYVKNIGLILLLLYLTPILNAQEYNILQYNGSSISTCSGIFSDPGGAPASYGPNSNATMSICSNDLINTQVKLYFTQFSVGTPDTLYIYDGPNTTSPLIGKYNNSNTLLHYTIKASINNTSGCLSFHFTSSPNGIGIGWKANISCTPHCQEIIPLVDTILCAPPPIDSAYMRICLHDTVTLAGKGFYPENNIFYPQLDSLNTFIWSFGDNTYDTGQIVKHVYDSIRGYDAKLTIIDQIGCATTNLLVHVCQAGTPLVNINMIPPLCVNDVLNIRAGYKANSTIRLQPVVYQQTSSLVYDSVTFIPDGGALGGNCYNTEILFNCFNPGQTVTSANDILSVCAKMEHSWVGDLGILLICPNGQQAMLKQYIQQGNAFLGVPLGGPNHQAFDCSNPPPCITDPAMNPPGEGWTYCWTMNNPEFSMMNNYSTGAQVDSGSFMPDADFSNLIGCPLNGNWNLQVCDYWAQDNGYVFQWELNLDAALLNSNWSYTVKFDSCAFTGPFITSHTDSSITINPTIPGLYTYSFTIYDEFGCSYDTMLKLLVKPLPVPALMQDTTICEGQPVSITASGGGSYHWSNGSSNPGIYVTPDTTTTYFVTVTKNACKGYDTVTVHVKPAPILSISPPAPPPLCPWESLSLSVSGAATYSWSPSTGLNTTLGPIVTANPANSQLYTVTGTAANGCTSNDTVSVNIATLPVINLGNDTILCIGLSTLLNPGNAFVSYQWNTGDTSHVLAVSQSGIYSITVTTSNTCSMSDSVWVNFVPGGMINLGPDTTICTGKSVQFSPGGTYASYQWSNGAITPTIQVSQSGAYSVSVTRADGCYDADTANLSVVPLPVDFWPDDTVTCSNQALLLSPGPFNAYLWQNNSTASAFPVTNTGTYWVRVTDITGCQGFDTIHATVNQAWSIAQDFTLCQGDSLLVNGHFLSSAGIYVDTLVTAQACDSIIVTTLTVNPLPQALLGPDRFACMGDTIILDAQNPGQTWLWSNGATTQTISIYLPGTYIVSVTSNLDCQNTDTVVCTFFALPQITLDPPEASICIDSAVTILASGALSYAWSPSAGLSSDTAALVSASPAATTTYTIHGTSAEGCSSDTSITLTVYPGPQSGLTDSIPFCNLSSVTLDPGNCSFCSYTWSTGEQSNVITVLEPGVFWVNISTPGCALTDTIIITECFEFDIPNAFSPNGDGWNDKFYIKGYFVRDFELTIMNRWGKVVYQSLDQAEGWDGSHQGQPCADGVYYYILTYSGKYGSQTTGRNIKQGGVTLMR